MEVDLSAGGMKAKHYKKHCPVREGLYTKRKITIQSYLYLSCFSFKLPNINECFPLGKSIEDYLMGINPTVNYKKGFL